MTDTTTLDGGLARSSGEPPVPTPNAGPERMRIRRRLLITLAVVLVVLACSTGVWWILVGQQTISTDNAYVAADSAEITPQVAGTIREVNVADTAHVVKGQPLVQLDPADAQLALDQARASYAQAIRQVEQDFSNRDQAAAQVRARESDLRKATIDYKRQAQLAQAGATSDQNLTDARNVYETAQANLVASQKTLASLQALVDGADVEHNPQVLLAKAAVETATLNLFRTVIRAPFDGVVAQRNAQIGQHVEVGQSLMIVVPVNEAYVDANFKEGQLASVHSGQSATLTSDLYGSGVVFHGRVQGLSGGTGSAFAVIPAQNATGNWIKVVQRLPVRIELDPRELSEHPLRVGLSMNASIDLSQ